MSYRTNIHPYVLSGGSGKRLWPLSRSLYPKQFVSVENKNSLFQDTLKRLNDPMYSKPKVICNIDHRFMVRDQAKNIGLNLDSIFLEPVGKNTTSSAIISSASADKDSLILLMPSDHIIKNKKIFNESVKRGIKFAQEGKIILFGVKPTRAETGFGYISVKKNMQYLVHDISKFIEKPNEKKAKKLLISKLVFWNSGIFLFKASTLLKNAEKFCPETLRNVKNSLKHKTFDNEFYYLSNKYFSKSKEISVDYSIIQKSNNLMMSELKTDWNDMGTWDSFWRNSKKDKNNNAVNGKVYIEDCHNSLVISDKQFVLTSGLKDFIIVSISNALLVVPKSKLKNLSKIIEGLAKKKFDVVKNSLKSYRPWGTYEILKTARNYQVKEIIINPGSAISLQKHKKRSEHWVVISGEATVTKGKKTFILKVNESIDIKISELHRLENNTKDIVKIIEIQSGTYLGEDDIIRYKDEYSRK